MTCDERMIILKELRNIDDVIKSIDKDRTVIESIKLVYEKYKNN